jgi:hypothetical protein
MIVIHIGLRKSGSTSIQAFLSQNAAALRPFSVDYPLVGRNRRLAHLNLAHELGGRDRFRPEAGSLDDLVAYRRANPGGTMILSSEIFEGLSAEAVARCGSVLSVLGETITILLVLRDLVSLTPSSYAQKVRYGHKTHDFDRFFERRRTEDRVDYFITAKRWADVFGRDNLKTLILGPRLIEDFVLAAGLPPEVARLPQAGIVNSASGWRVLEAMRSFHKGRQRLPAGHPLREVAALCAGLGHIKALPHEIRLEQVARSVGADMGWMEDRGRYLTWDQADWCARTYDDAIAALNAYFESALPTHDGLASRGFVAREFLPDAALIPARDLRTFYDAVGEGLLSAPPVGAKVHQSE